MSGTLARAGFAAATAALRPAATTGATTTVVVARGDTLWAIAQKHLGDGNRYPEILALNPGVNATSLAVGAPLRLPSGGSPAAAAVGPVAKNSAPAPTVKPASAGPALPGFASGMGFGGGGGGGLGGGGAWGAGWPLGNPFFAALSHSSATSASGASTQQATEPSASTTAAPAASVYANQRDNATSYDQSKGKQWTYDRASGDQYLVADRMCNVTSLAMALATMMGSIAKARALTARVLDERYGDKTFSALKPEALATKQLEDMLDVVIQHEYKVTARPHRREDHEVYEGVLDIFSEYDESGIADADFLSETDTTLSANAKKRLTEDAVRDGKTVQQLLEQGDTFVIRSVIPVGGGHISLLKSISADGITIHDPYGANLLGSNPIYDNCLVNEVGANDRLHNLKVVQRLVGNVDDVTKLSGDETKRSDLMSAVLASESMKRRFTSAPASVDVLSNLAYYYYKGDYDHAAPLFGQFGESVFYTWAECKALQVPSMLLDVKKRA